MCLRSHHLHHAGQSSDQTCQVVHKAATSKGPSVAMPCPCSYHLYGCTTQKHANHAAILLTSSSEHSAIVQAGEFCVDQQGTVHVARAVLVHIAQTELIDAPMTSGGDYASAYCQQLYRW
eukprot:20383-Heterococcus_DN1.PRE.3